MEWIPFLIEEFKSAIAKCNNLFTSDPNRVLWKYLKSIVEDDMCLKNIVNIVNKTSYDSFKMFQPIVLLNILEKIKKVIRKRLQF